jgi:hypothetical protein
VLVLPGDGSWSGLRTPVVGFSAVPVTRGLARHPRYPARHFAKCPNINAIRPGDIVELAAGRTLKLGVASLGQVGPLDDRGLPVRRKRGKWSVAYHYINNPNKEWRGVTYVNSDARDAVRRSTYCELRSNTLEFTE